MADTVTSAAPCQRSDGPEREEGVSRTAVPLDSPAVRPSAAASRLRVASALWLQACRSFISVDSSAAYLESRPRPAPSKPLLAPHQSQHCPVGRTDETWKWGGGCSGQRHARHVCAITPARRRPSRTTAPALCTLRARAPSRTAAAPAPLRASASAACRGSMHSESPPWEQGPQKLSLTWLPNSQQLTFFRILNTEISEQVSAHGVFFAVVYWSVRRSSTCLQSDRQLRSTSVPYPTTLSRFLSSVISAAAACINGNESG